MSRIDDAVRRILCIKFRAALFDHPYVDQTKAQQESTCTLSNSDLYDPAGECATDAGFAAAVAAAKAADQVVIAVGDTREMSGEASRARCSTCRVDRRT
jgi:beta-glucosidase-like glycosyl hydrolase